MDSLRDRANLLLVALLMAAVAGIAIVAVLHGYSQEKMDARAASLEDNLTRCGEEYLQLESTLQQLSAEANSSQQSVRVYDRLYGAAMDTLAATNASLQRTESLLSVTSLDRDRLQQYAASLDATIAQQRETIKNQGAEIIRLRQQLRSCESTCRTP